MKVIRRHMRWTIGVQPFRLWAVLLIALLVSAVVVAACSQTSAAVPAAEPTGEPLPVAESLDDVEIDDDTTWQEVFDQLAASEQDCIRTELAEGFDAVLSEPIVDADFEDDAPWLESIVDCLPEETVRTVWTTILIRYWLDSLGLVLSADEESCLRRSSLAENVQGMADCVSDLFGVIGDAVDAADDHAGTRSGATALFDGQEAEGTLDSAIDIDIFQFEAVEGSRYRLDAALETLNSALLILVDFDGEVLTHFDAYEHSGESTAIWLAPTSADYFVAVLGPYSNTGTYGLTVSRIVDDHPDSASGAASLAIGEMVEGSVDHYEDRDAFAFEVEEGLFYLLDVGLGTLGDSNLAVEDAEGELLAENDDRYRGEYASRIVWKASASGRFYAVLSGDRSEIGTYTLTFATIMDDHVDRRPGSTAVTLGEAVNGALTYERDVDVFSFETEERVIYEVAVASETLVEPVFGVVGGDTDYLAGNIAHPDYWTPRIAWKAPDEGTYYVVMAGQGVGAYTLTVNATDLVDRHADTTSDATSTAFGETMQGAIEHIHDEDLFAFDATEGVIYEISVGSGTLSEPILSVVEAQKRQLANNYNYPNPRNMEILWQAPTSERYYVLVSGQGTGTYSLTIDETQLVDVHGNTISEASTTTVGEDVSARIDHIHDEDVFVFEASEGVIYEVVLTQETLENVLVYLKDVDDDALAQIDFDDDPEVSRLIWKAAVSGDYYVVVDSRDTGTYTLIVGKSLVVDDHADAPSGATRMREGRVVQGAMDYEDDADVFVFTAKEGALYDIDVDLGTLEDSVMTVEDGDGTTLVWKTSNSDDREVRAFWTAPAAGEYYVQIRRTGYGSRPGTYTLTVSQVVDDHADSEQLATAIVVGESVQGSIDDPWDRDWFVFEGEEGVAYRIEASLGTLPGASLFLEDSNDDWLALNDDVQAPPPTIVFYPASSGGYFVRVSNSSYPGMGTYTLTVSAVQIQDDHGGKRSEATPLEVGEAATGSVDYVEDWDVFVFEAEAGVRYEITVAKGTLSEWVLDLWRSDATLVARDQVWEDTQSSQISWEAPVSGKYYASVRGYFYRVGAYTLTLTENPPTDATPVQ